MSQAGKGGVWSDPRQAENYLANTRGAIPLAVEQLRLAVKIVETTALNVDRILDLGCGDGVMGLAMARRWPSAKLTLVDYSATMLAAAGEKMAAEGVEAEVMKLDFSEPSWATAVAAHGPMDLVVSGFAIHHQPGERKAGLYRQVFDLLAPGGVFINLDNVSSPTDKLSRLFEEDFVDALTEDRRRRGLGADRELVRNEWMTRRREDLQVTSPLDRQLEWLVDIGFENVDCYFKYLEFALFGGTKPKARQ